MSGNLLEMIPVRRQEWMSVDDGSVHVMVPRFGGRLGGWLARRLGGRPIRVKLDEVGSAVWLACDGSATVGEIADRLGPTFGTRIQPANDRLALFFAEMERGHLIRWQQRRHGAAPVS